MLVLTRKLEEGIVISINKKDNVTITVFEIKKNQIRLGIEAPKEYRILRKELIDGSR